MRIAARIVGTTPLVMHNIRLADPDDEFAKAIAEISSKRKRTEQDRLERARLEFTGSLYIDSDGPFVPAANVRRCLTEAAKVRRLGKQVTRAVVPITQKLPLEYQGPRTPEKLWADGTYRYQAACNVGGQRVQRMRPQFREWALTIEIELVTEAMDRDDFIAITEQAGMIEGLGDNRINGYGRFRVEWD